MRAFIYNPYLETLGGGERYILTAAIALREKGFDVDVYAKDTKISEKFNTRFGIDLTNINFIRKNSKGDGYDLSLWLSDGSIPLLHSRKNILHFQMPFRDVNGRSLLTRMKMFRINKVIVNSNFTKKYIDAEFGIESTVLYPPVDTASFKPKRKDNIILYVGRFSQLTQSKHQDILVNAFSRLVKKGFADWKLVLAGGVEVGVGDQLISLKEMAKGMQVEIFESPNFKTIKDLYGVSKIFWSGSGYGVDVKYNPERVEHFGITIVEAMSAGCVPVVVNSGGHTEIIENGVDGILFEKVSELVESTAKLISDKKRMLDMSKKAVEKSKIFDTSEFKENFIKIIS